MLYIILVVVVAFKKLLHTIAAQLLLTFTNLFCIFPFLVIDMICIKVVNMDVRDVRRLH